MESLTDGREDSIVERLRGRGPVEIDRVDGQRVTYLTANLESGVALGDAVESVRAALRDVELPPGFSILYGGQYEEQLKARRDFSIAIVMALVLVYMLMAAQFERFFDPLIVMLAVPMAVAFIYGEDTYDTFGTGFLITLAAGALLVLLMVGAIWTFFWLQNPRFLSPGNLTNLMLQQAAVATISTSATDMRSKPAGECAP